MGRTAGFIHPILPCVMLFRGHDDACCRLTPQGQSGRGAVRVPESASGRSPPGRGLHPRPRRPSLPHHRPAQIPEPGGERPEQGLRGAAAAPPPRLPPPPPRSRRPPRTPRLSGAHLCVLRAQSLLSDPPRQPHPRQHPGDGTRGRLCRGSSDQRPPVSLRVKGRRSAQPLSLGAGLPRASHALRRGMSARRSPLLQSVAGGVAQRPRLHPLRPLLRLLPHPGVHR
mmetsp:Transcript_54920/g.128425  ORF Transcript_54920/g.128425 Transcript_54920/m.128425 type:complete len:226 (+) Transcript_54920:700-1377(+)